jgi:hypothetical protein
MALRVRYLDYVDCNVDKVWDGILPPLPNPFNKGLSWYQEVRDVYNRDKGRDFKGWSLGRYREWKRA